VVRSTVGLTWARRGHLHGPGGHDETMETFCHLMVSRQDASPATAKQVSYINFTGAQQATAATGGTASDQHPDAGRQCSALHNDSQLHLSRSYNATTLAHYAPCPRLIRGCPSDPTLCLHTIFTVRRPTKWRLP